MTTAMHQLQEIDASTLKRWIDKHEALLLDVREPDEFAQEHIPEAGLMPLSTFDPANIPQPSDQRVVLQCRSGKRSAQAAQKLFEAGFKRVIHLKGGLLAWKAAGYSTDVAPNTSGSSLRLLSVVLGVFLLGGASLGPLISPWTLMLSILAGGSLVWSGVTAHALER